MVDEGRRLAGEHGFGLWVAALGGVAGAIHVARGEPAAAVPELELALAEFRRLGVLMHTPTILAGLGAARLQLGRLSEGLAAVDEGIELGRSTRSCWYEPELWTLRGRLLAAQGASPGDVESAFAQAVKVARSHGALSLELRATTERAEWLAASGRGGDMRATLAACHARFREGADTADLRRARELLARLGT
jgi:predicted ATPase